MKRKITAILLVVALALSLGLVPAASVGASPDPGLVGLWHLDEGTGSIASDSSGNGNDGTLEGGFGTALSFDGNDYVEIASNSSIMPATLTVEAWIQPGKIGVRQSIVSKWDGGGDASYSLELTSTNKFLFYLHNGTTTQFITGTTVITVGEWYHVAGTYDGSQASLYVNDALEAGPTVLVAPMTTSSVPLRIGASAKKAPYPIYVPFEGVIDEVRLSNVARTSFSLTAPPSADVNTVGLWRFNEGSGQTAGDSAGSNLGQLGATASVEPSDPTWVTSGVPAGPQWVSDQWGGYALSFDGNDDYVEVPDSSTLEPSTITVEAWVKNAGTPGTFKYIISKVYVAKLGGYSSYAFYTGGSGGLRFYVGSASTWVGSPDAGASLWDGNWHHIAGTYDGSKVRLFVDGSQVGTGTSATLTIAYDSGNLHIGYYGPYAYPTYFPGLIDEVRIWDTATPSFNLYAEPNPGYNLVDTEHTVTATVTIDKVGDDGTEPAPGVLVDFSVAGMNTDIGSDYTDSNGEATFTYTGDGGAGIDTITAEIDQDPYQYVSDEVTKYWFLNFVTGGGTIKTIVGYNKQGKPIEQVAWNLSGNVGYFEEDSTPHGQFNIIDHVGKIQYHCPDEFSSLIFYGGTAESPEATFDTAKFTGTFYDKDGTPHELTIVIEDNGEPGKGVDKISVSEEGVVHYWVDDAGNAGNPVIIDGGNYQIHEGYKG